MLSKLRKKIPIVSVLSALFIIFASGCGVKGDPVPPDKPPEIGRGQPTYRKATEKIQLQKYTPSDDDKEDKEPEDE